MFNFLFFMLLFVCSFITSSISWASVTNFDPNNPPSETALNRSDCFRPGENKLINYTIDQNRISLGSCTDDAVRSVKEFVSYPPYADERGTIYSCVNIRKNALKAARFKKFTNEFIAMSEAAQTAETVEDRETNAKCAANMLFHWAKNDGMTLVNEEFYSNSEQARMWSFSAVVAAYFKSNLTQQAAKQMRALGDTKHSKIIDWTNDIAYQTAARKGKVNNIKYWRGYALLASALLLKDSELYLIAQDTFNVGLNDVVSEQNGFLEAELHRGRLAQHYHVFGAQALLGMALLSKSYGCDLANNDYKKRTLASLARHAVVGHHQPDFFMSYSIPRIKQKTTNGNNLIFLAHQLDKSISANITSFVKKNVNGSPDLSNFKYKSSASSFENRFLGGNYVLLNNAIQKLQNNPNNKFCK